MNKPKDSDPRPIDRLLNRNWNLDMAEESREGDEMTGDDHSSGLQGGEPEIGGQEHITTGLPGDETTHEELEERKRSTA